MMQEASYIAPPESPHVRQYPGGRSYHTNDTAALITYLTREGWRRYPPKAGNEMCRLWRSDSLILIYLSGSIAVGGKRPEVAHLVLGELLEEPTGKQLSFWAESEAL